MEVIDGKDKSKENEKEDEVKIVPVFSGHRILEVLIYEKGGGKVKFRTGPRILRRLKNQVSRIL